MSVYVLAFTKVNPENPDALSAYLAAMQPLFEKAGAEIVQRYKIEETLVGVSPARIAVLAKYRSRQAVYQMLESSEYGALGEIRKLAFSEYHISIVKEFS